MFYFKYNIKFLIIFYGMNNYSLFCSNSANVISFILNILTDQRNSVFLFVIEKYCI